jgi:CheY-like chemotaxis protein
VGFEPGAALAPGQPAGGIGLFSMRERLDVIGGGMKIQSAIGSGTRVTVWVPADGSRLPIPAAPPPPSRPSENRALPREPSGKIRVLLADDHAVVRNGIALQLLQQPDIEVVGEAADGRNAVELVRSLRPDVVTMDVNMPGMNGVDAARAIHSEFPATRIIGLSMSDESEQGAAMRSAGAEHYLSKSASLDRLLAAIRGPSGRE